MYDIELKLSHHPGALAKMGRALGEAGHSVEGGGAWLCGDSGIAHFLFADGAGAAAALEAAGIEVTACRQAVLLQLKQEVPGQLGLLTGRMADAGVNIETLYSDHDNQLVLVVDDAEAAREVARKWMADREA